VQLCFSSDGSLNGLPNSLLLLSSNGVSDKKSSWMLIYETHTQVNIQKMAALLKLNEMRSVIRNGSIFNKWRHFNKGEWNERFLGRVAQEVVRRFCFNRPGKQKKFFTKIKWNQQNITLAKLYTSCNHQSPMI